MQKKRWKEIVVATLLVSTFLLPPSQIAYGKTFSVQQSIDEVKMEMKKATQAYIDPAIEGELVPSASLDSLLNSVKRNYQEVRKTILASNLSEKEKQAKLKEIDALYEEKIIKGLIPYIDAYNYATKYLEPILKEIEEAEAKNDFAAIEKAYHKLSVQLKSRSAILYRFTGKAARDLLLEKYKKPSNEKRDELIIPVTIYMKIADAQQLLLEGKKDEAQKILEGIPALVAELSSTNALHQVVIKELERLQGSVLPKIETPITPPVTPPTTGGGGGNGGSSETSEQRALRIAKADANATLTKYKVEADYSKENWLEITSLIEMGKKNINSARTVDAVTQALTNAQVKLDQVLTLAQESTTVYVKDETELRNAVSDTSVSTIVLSNDIELNQYIEITHPIELFGNGKTITAYDITALSIINASNTKINNLVIEADPNSSLEEAILIVNSADVQLMNITITEAVIGVVAIDSTVTAHNIKTVGTFETALDLYGGVLTVTGTSSHADLPGSVSIIKEKKSIVNSNQYEEVTEFEDFIGAQAFVLKGTKPSFVSNLIPLIDGDFKRDRPVIELLRSIYNGLTPAVKSQVTNIALLEQNEQKLADGMAREVGPTYQAPEYSIGTISLPTVDSGFTISVHSSTDENIYDKDGKILADGLSTVVYTVTHTMSGKMANTQPVGVSLTSNQAPIATNVMISGSLKVGSTLSGAYYYYDQERDTEGTSTFNWYRADQVSSPKVIISGATSKMYTLTPDDLGKYIYFEVTPAANTGKTLGLPTLSYNWGDMVVE